MIVFLLILDPRIFFCFSLFLVFLYFIILIIILILRESNWNLVSMAIDLSFIYSIFLWIIDAILLLIIIHQIRSKTKHANIAELPLMQVNIRYDIVLLLLFMVVLAFHAIFVNCWNSSDFALYGISYGFVNNTADYNATCQSTIFIRLVSASCATFLFASSMIYTHSRLFVVLKGSKQHRNWLIVSRLTLLLLIIDVSLTAVFFSDGNSIAKLQFLTDLSLSKLGLNAV
jgi:hypothetical protein